MRDRALLETMYATGIRVSELINLKLKNLHEDLKLVKVLGKGSKERLIPISEVALSWIKRYEKKFGIHYFYRKTKVVNSFFSIIVERR